jgi:hypothetical protein
VASLRSNVRKAWLAQQPAASRGALLLARHAAVARANLVDS